MREGESGTVGIEPLHSVKISRPPAWNSDRAARPKFMSAEAMSEQLQSGYGISMSPDRLRELSVAGYLPYYEIDGDSPYFYPSELRDYVKEKMVVGRGAEAVPGTDRCRRSEFQESQPSERSIGSCFIR